MSENYVLQFTVGQTDVWSLSLFLCNQQSKNQRESVYSETEKQLKLSNY